MFNDRVGFDEVLNNKEHINNSTLKIKNSFVEAKHLFFEKPKVRGKTVL